MKIAYLYHRSDTMGGAPIHLRDLGRRLIMDGHETKVFIGGDGPFLAHLEEHGVPYQRLKHLQRDLHPLHDFAGFFELVSQLRKYRPDLISAHCPKAGFLGRLAGKCLGIPTVYSPHCWPFAEGSPKASLYLALEKMVAPLSRHIFLVSEDERREALQHHLCDSSMMTTIHNGMIDATPEKMAQPEREPLRMIMVARFEPQKDHATLFRALEKLSHLDWHLDLVGSGPGEAQFREKAAQWGWQDRIVFHGHSTRVPELLLDAQLFLLVTNWEGFPRSTLEAMRAGLPSVITDVGGNREAFVSGDEGLVVKRGDAMELAEALESLILDPDRRRRMGRAARRTFEAQFTFERMYEKYRAAYERLLGLEAAPPTEVRPRVQEVRSPRPVTIP